MEEDKKVDKETKAAQMAAARDTFAKAAIANVGKHKGKMTAVAVLGAIGLAILEAWPQICPMIPYVNTSCGITAPLVNIGKDQLEEAIKKHEQEGQGGGSNE